MTIRSLPVAALLTALALGGCTRTEQVTTPRREGTTIDDRQEGLWRYRHAGGQPEALGSFHTDKQVGPWVWWYPTGTEKALGTYAPGGQREGWWTLFHPTGAIKAEGRFHRDRQDGVWRYFDAEGNLRTVTYRMGVVVADSATPAPVVAAPKPAPKPEPSAPVVTQAQAPVSAPTPVPVPAPVTPAALASPVAESPAPEQLPGTWTVREEQVASRLIEAYTNGARAGGDDYAWSQPTSSGDPQGSKLVGHHLTQRRFLSSTGKVIDLGKATRPTVLVIMRGFSGNICLYCATQTAALSNQAARFHEAGVDLMVLFPGPTESVPAFVQAVKGLRKDPPPMPIGLDVSLDLVQELGIIGDLATPTSLIVEPGGVIRWAYVGKDIDDRPSVKDLLLAAGQHP